MTISILIITLTASAAIAILYLKIKRGIAIKKNYYISKDRLSLYDREIQLVCNYMERNYKNSTLTIDQICSDLKTGKEFVNRLFCTEIGLTPEQFLTKLRIHHTVSKIKTGSAEEIDEVARDCGFSSFEDFVTQFNDNQGITLYDFLKNLKKTLQSPTQ